MARPRKISITVPGHLADALDRVGAGLDVDGICSTALERECRTVLDAQRKDGALGGAVARFRAQRVAILGRAKEEGFRAGRQFVLERADYDTALALEKLYKLSLRDQVDDLGRDLTEALAAHKGVLPRKPSSEWLQGFSEGAMDVWLRIRAEVEA
jgi:hypothetical protein